MKGIILSAQEIHALQQDRLSLLCRPITPSSSLFDGRVWPGCAKEQEWDWGQAWVDPGPSPAGNPGPYLKLPWLRGNEPFLYEGTVHRIYPNPWAEQTVYVKETWKPSYVCLGSCTFEACDCGDIRVVYTTDNTARVFNDAKIGSDWEMPKTARTGNVSPVVMPEWASRYRLQIENVRVLRLQNITEDEAIQCGVERHLDGWKPYGKSNPYSVCDTARCSLKMLLQQRYGAGAWEANGFVWVYEVRKVVE